MLAAFFLTILQMSVTAGFVCLAVCLLRLFLRRAPRIFSYGLWAVVFFRFVCPAALPSPVSVVPDWNLLWENVWETGSLWGRTASGADTPADGGLTDGDGLGVNSITKTDGQEGAGLYKDEEGLHPEAAGSSAAGAWNQTGSAPWVNGQDGNAGYLPGDVLGTDGRTGNMSGADKVRPWAYMVLPEPVWEALAAVWLGGILCLGVFYLWKGRRWRRSLEPLAGQERGIYTSPGIRAPFVMGLLRPAIYLPERLAGQERELVLLHEETHLRRRDYVIKPLALMVACVHWFNPLAWLAFRLMCMDMELSCDESVLRQLNRSQRKSYAEALLSFAGEGACAEPSFGEPCVRKRIRNVLSYRRPAYRLSLMLAVLCMAAVGCLATNRTGAEPDDRVVDMTGMESPGTDGEIYSSEKNDGNVSGSAGEGVPGSTGGNVSGNTGGNAPGSTNGNVPGSTNGNVPGGTDGNVPGSTDGNAVENAGGQNSPGGKDTENPAVVVISQNDPAAERAVAGELPAQMPGWSLPEAMQDEVKLFQMYLDSTEYRIFLSGEFTPVGESLSGVARALAELLPREDITDEERQSVAALSGLTNPELVRVSREELRGAWELVAGEAWSDSWPEQYLTDWYYLEETDCWYTTADAKGVTEARCLFVDKEDDVCRVFYEDMVSASNSGGILRFKLEDGEYKVRSNVRIEEYEIDLWKYIFSLSVGSVSPQFTEERTVWQADLTHDGQMELVVFDWGYLKEYMLATLTVVDAEGTVIFSDTDMGSSHPGWCSYYLCSLEEEGVRRDYLLKYVPYSMQGYGDYSYELFSLDGAGGKNVRYEQSVSFPMDRFAIEMETEGSAPDETEMEELADSIAAFVQAVNSYISQSFLVGSTDYDSMEQYLLYSTPGHLVRIPELCRFAYNYYGEPEAEDSWDIQEMRDNLDGVGETLREWYAAIAREIAEEQAQE